MVCNPVMVAMGFDMFDVYSTHDDIDFIDADFFKNSKDIASQAIGQLFSKRNNKGNVDAQKNNKYNQDQQQYVNADLDEFDFDVFSAIQQVKNVNPGNVARANINPTENQEEEKAIEELERYIEFCREIDWEEHITLYHKKEYDAEGSIVWNKVTNKRDALYCAQVLDLMSWWSTHSALSMFPRVGVLASIYLGKPFTNGFQERVFSQCTFIDTDLRQRMKPTTFEMRVLDKTNRHLSYNQDANTNCSRKGTAYPRKELRVMSSTPVHL